MTYVRQLVPEAQLRIRQERIHLNALLEEDCLDLAEAAPAYVDRVGHYRLNSLAVLKYPGAVYNELARISHGTLTRQEAYHAVVSANRFLRAAFAEN